MIIVGSDIFQCGIGEEAGAGVAVTGGEGIDLNQQALG